MSRFSCAVPGPLNIAVSSGVLWGVKAMRSATALLGLAVSFALVAPTAAAQRPSPTPDPAAAIADAERVALRVEQEMVCLRDKHREMQRAVVLMREAQAQARTGSNEAIRRDAGDAIRSLQQRMVRLEREVLACRRQASVAARADGPVEGVVTRDPPADPRADAVATRNPATRVVESDILLVGNVRAVRGEQVDGRGRVSNERVRDVIRSAASGIDRCYERMAGRAALERGRLLYTFTITSSGTVTRIRTEGSTFRNASFLRCVRGTARGIRVAGGASGGEATFTYTLQLPAT